MLIGQRPTQIPINSKARFKHIIEDLQRSRQVLKDERLYLSNLSLDLQKTAKPKPRPDFENFRIRAMVDSMESYFPSDPPIPVGLQGDMQEMLDLALILH